MAILGIGLVVVANSYLLALRGITSAQNNIQAQFLAKAKFDELEEKNIQAKGLSQFNETSVLKGPTRDYNYILEITEISSPEYLAKDLIQACIQLNWQEQNAVKKAVFSSLFPLRKEDVKPKTKSI